MSASTTYDWLKQLPSALLRQDEIPLLGFPPPFPWEQLSAKLAELFAISDLSIKPATSFEWRTGENLFSGMGDKLVPLHVSIAPTGGTLCWIMPESDITLLMQLLLKQEQQPLDIIDPDFQQGFYRFLAIETIHSISRLDFDKALSAHIMTSQDLPKEDALCLDISIETQQKTVWGRLVISAELRQKWKERYAQRTLEIPVSERLNLTIGLEVGRIRLKPSEWSQLAVGDFLILDSCTLEPDGKGKILLRVEGLPLFNAELQNGKINILEYSSYHEGDADMTHDPDNNEEIEEEEEEEEELEEEPEEEEEEAEEEEEPEEEEEEFELDEEPQEKWPPPPERRPVQPQQPQPQPAQAASTPVESAPEEKSVSLGDVPLPVIIEVGRLQMSLQKLTQLQPGNLLELNVRPEDGVDLIVNGKRIAKGELLRIGESLGVRILDI